MKHSYVLFGASLAASTFSVLAAQPAPVIDVSNATNTLLVANTVSTGNNTTNLVDQLTNIERKLDLRNRAQIKLQNQLTDLQTELDEIRGITELHEHKLSQILERQRELYQELDKRVDQAINTTQTPVVVNTPTIPAVIDYSSDLTENEAYDHAVNLVLKDKQYEQAIVEFNHFNEKYPTSTYAANAHYWLGQLLFNKSDLSAAAQEFSVVVNEYKNSSKRSDALLKLATVAHKQNNTAQAQVLYKQLIAEYPNSSAAKLAEPRLATILKP
jgi:tol-pal system protein YbgF